MISAGAYIYFLRPTLPGDDILKFNIFQFGTIPSPEANLSVFLGKRRCLAAEIDSAFAEGKYVNWEGSFESADFFVKRSEYR